MSKCKHTHTQTCTHTHTLSLWVFLFQPSLLIFSLSYYYPSLLRVSYFNTNAPHTPGLSVASCTVVCPINFPSTSTLQKGSESPLLLVCARGWWHSVCQCTRAREACVCVQNRIFDASHFAYFASDTCLQSYIIVYPMIRLDEMTYGNWYSRPSSSWVSIACKMIFLFRMCGWRLSVLLVIKPGGFAEVVVAKRGIRDTYRRM